MSEYILGSPETIKRILIIGVLSYFMLIIMLRIMGKRTLSKMNAFDLIVTVALGSTFATVIIDTSIALLEGLAAMGVLIILQYIVTFTTIRIKAISQLVKSEPALLYYKGKFIKETMKKERVTKEEMDQAVRNSGFGRYDEVTAVILETDGSFSVLSSDGDLTQNLDSVHETSLVSK